MKKTEVGHQNEGLIEGSNEVEPLIKTPLPSKRAVIQTGAWPAGLLGLYLFLVLIIEWIPPNESLQTLRVRVAYGWIFGSWYAFFLVAFLAWSTPRPSPWPSIALGWGATLGGWYIHFATVSQETEHPWITMLPLCDDLLLSGHSPALVRLFAINIQLMTLVLSILLWITFLRHRDIIVESIARRPGNPLQAYWSLLWGARRRGTRARRERLYQVLWPMVWVSVFGGAALHLWSAGALQNRPSWLEHAAVVLALSVFAGLLPFVGWLWWAIQRQRCTQTPTDSRA